MADNAPLITTFAWFCARISNLFTCSKHLHDRSISLIEQVRAQKNSLTPPLFIEGSVPRQESERFVQMCVRGINFASKSNDFSIRFFGTVIWFVRKTNKYILLVRVMVLTPLSTINQLFPEYTEKSADLSLANLIT